MNIKVINTINKFNMINNNDNIVVGLSGGADSVSLIHFLHNYKQHKNIKVIAAHINHCIRGEEADRDENFVKNFCDTMKIELYIKRVDVRNLSVERGIGLEECGRNVRYEYFSELASKFGCKIATAHSLSDSEETVLLNIARGCGLKGLCGIPPVRNNIIRPLIFVSRSEIEDYCRRNSLDYVTDSTNLALDYTRNKIRINLIPILKDVNNTFDNVFRRMILQNIDDECYLEEISEKEFNKSKLSDGYDIVYINRLKSSIRNRVIKKILQSYSNHEIENKHIKAASDIINNMYGAITLPYNVNICVSGTKLVKRLSDNKDAKWEYKFYYLNVLTESDVRFIIEIFTINEYNSKVKEKKLKNYVALDSESIPEDAVFRNRRQGDKFCQQARGVTKKVKKLFTELKIPQENRNKIVMLASGSKILWIDGIGICEDSRIKDNTKFVTVIRRETIND